MAKLNKVVVNAAYRDLFKNQENLRRDEFVVSSIDEYEVLDNNTLTRTLALAFQQKDSLGVLYGIEIKSNGSSRSGRIPLVRVVSGQASIWKIAQEIEDLEKAVIALDQLFYFLKEHNDENYPLPIKVIVLRGEENSYGNSGAPYYQFVQNLIKKSGTILFSLQFLQKTLTKNEPLDVDAYLKDVGKIFVTI